GLVELFFPDSASAAPTAPPAAPPMIATFAPVDMPCLVGFGAVGAGLGGVAGTSVFASRLDATLRQPPGDRGATPVTFTTDVAILTVGFVLAAVPVTSTRLPTLRAKSGPFNSTTSCVFSSCRMK